MRLIGLPYIPGWRFFFRVMVLGAPLIRKNDTKNIFDSDLISYGAGRAANELKLIQREVGYRKPFHEKRKLLAVFAKRNFETFPQKEKVELLEQVKSLPA